MHLHPAHVATLIAGLRLMQATHPSSLPIDITDVLTDGGTLRRITDLEIDSLATMLNTSGDNLLVVSDAERDLMADGVRQLVEMGLDEDDIGGELAERLGDTDGEPEYVQD